MIKAAGKAVVYMIIDLVNQITIEEVIPAEWETVLRENEMVYKDELWGTDINR